MLTAKATEAHIDQDEVFSVPHLCKLKLHESNSYKNYFTLRNIQSHLDAVLIPMQVTN